MELFALFYCISCTSTRSKNAGMKILFDELVMQVLLHLSLSIRKKGRKMADMEILFKEMVIISGQLCFSIFLL